MDRPRSLAERARRRVLEPFRRRALGPFMSRLGYDLLPAVPEWVHRPLSAREVDRLIAEAAGQLAADLGRAGLEAPSNLEAMVGEFMALIGSSPVRQRHGGNGFNGALQIYAVARALDPPIIIESGVFRGFTTWILRQACPRARIFCFDPAPPRSRWRDPRATYGPGDWSGFDFSGVDLSNALALFDDHISQERRVLEAGSRAITRLLFDDDAEAHCIHGQGGPAYPTVGMILAARAEDEPVRWLRNGREFAWRPGEGTREARSRIAVAQRFHDMHRITGYSPARLTYVGLREP
ncbi:MAG TPA: hypothetical protein VKA80_06105 [Beijerinckiaceae bacterium]|jgi:hypothetical protein|nr:hypothetical protein [Beijerinckiaceae bacterium]